MYKQKRKRMMSKDKMHNYLEDQTVRDLFPEAWEVKEIYDKAIAEKDREIERLEKEVDEVYAKNRFLTKELYDSVDKRMKCIQWLEDKEGLEATHDILYEGEAFVMIDSVLDKLKESDK